jgi:acyl-CoA thioester hydrolase
MQQPLQPSMQPTAGYYIDKIHYLPLRVYYEDTDVSGLVYHANYLRYFERARSDMVRLIGIDQAALLAKPPEERQFFAIRSIHIEYISPAYYDDMLVVNSHLAALKAASFVIDQCLMREDKMLCKAHVQAAFLKSDGRPTRLLASARQAMQQVLIAHGS